MDYKKAFMDLAEDLDNQWVWKQLYQFLKGIK